MLFCFLNGLHAVRVCDRYLYSNTLTGTIPDSIGSLSALKQLCVLVKLAVASLVRARAGERRAAAFLLCAGVSFVFAFACFFRTSLGWLPCAFDACVRASHTWRPKLLSGVIGERGGGRGGRAR